MIEPLCSSRWDLAIAKNFPVFYTNTILSISIFDFSSNFLTVSYWQGKGQAAPEWDLNRGIIQYTLQKIWPWQIRTIIFDDHHILQRNSTPWWGWCSREISEDSLSSEIDPPRIVLSLSISTNLNMWSQSLVQGCTVLTVQLNSQPEFSVKYRL